MAILHLTPGHSILNEQTTAGHETPSKASTAIPTTAPTLSLEAYVSNLFYPLTLQDDHRMFNETYDKNWSRDVKEV